MIRNIVLAASLALAGCEDIEELKQYQQNRQLIEQIQEQTQEETKRDIEGLRQLEQGWYECTRKASLLPIGAREDQLPCVQGRDKDGVGHVNITETSHGTTSQWVYERPNGGAVYLYFDETGKLVAKQS